MKVEQTAATAVFSFPAFTAARPSAFRASRTGRWVSTGGRILMGLGSISRRSDAYLACVGPLSQIVRRQGKRSSARVARPQSRHGCCACALRRATWHACGIDRHSLAPRIDSANCAGRERIRAIVGVFCACRYLSFVAICREFELSTNSDRTAMCGGSRAPIHQGTMVWQ
jgi:hypothetical protein